MISRRDAPQWMKDAGRHGVRMVGRATAGGRKLPDFLIVGTQRGGTTSLFRALAEHPGTVQPSFHKGVHYFDVNYHRSLSWYKGHFPLRLLTGRTTSGALPQAFESAGYYMHHPEAPQRIARDLPGVKLIAILRDPVERAYSAHRHELMRGFETEEFERAIELEPSRLAGEIAEIKADPSYLSHSHRHHSYIDRGQYVDQLEVLFNLFGQDRVKVVFAENFFEQPETVFDEVIEFLGLEHWRPSSFERHNARPRSPMPESLRKKLVDHYVPYDERLGTLLGRTPAWRR